MRHTITLLFGVLSVGLVATFCLVEDLAITYTGSDEVGNLLSMKMEHGDEYAANNDVNFNCREENGNSIVKACTASQCLDIPEGCDSLHVKDDLAIECSGQRK